MKVSIIRKRDNVSPLYVQEFIYLGDKHISIISLLEYLNKEFLPNKKNSIISYGVSFDSSCQQGVCGACAMVVNGKPVLACQTFCDEIEDNDGNIFIQPLSKFPMVQDLLVDREELFSAIKFVRSLNSNEQKQFPLPYAISHCLMCGCCLEKCINYELGDMSKFVSVLQKYLKKYEQAKKDVFYLHIKETTKGIICPMNMVQVSVVSNDNELSVWRLWEIIRELKNIISD